MRVTEECGAEVEECGAAECESAWQCAVASCGSIGVEWFGNAADRSYGIENHQRLHTHAHTHTCSAGRVQ